MGKIDKYFDYLGLSCIFAPTDFKDKHHRLFDFITYMLNRTQSMFKYSGLPESIPQRDLELIIQCRGCAGIAKVNDTLYAFGGDLGGEQNAYYMPTLFTVSNPYLEYSASLEIDKQCCIIPNDSSYRGLIPLISKYGTLLVENELSLNIASINSRIISLISAPDDRTAESAREYLKQVIEGKIGIISSNEFFEGIKVSPYGGTKDRSILDLLEYEQYIKASLYNELGLNANYNMKREALNSGESKLNDDLLFPLVDDMLRCRQNALEKVNEMFGTDIRVELASSWEDNEEEVDAAQEALEAESGGAGAEENPSEDAAASEEEPKEDSEGGEEDAEEDS